MLLRRTTFNATMGNPTLQKALAITLFIKSKVGRSSMFTGFTINKLSLQTKISPNTLKKYLPIMVKQGWIRYAQGRGNTRHLVINNMSASRKHRNLNLEAFTFSSFKDVYYSLRALIVVRVQARKDYIRRLLQLVTNPKKGDDYRSARKKVRQLVRKGLLGMDWRYKEYGISYNRFAKELKSSVRTALEVVKFAIEKNWMTKFNKRSIQTCAPHVNHDYIEGYTFSSKNNLYVVYANTYAISPAMHDALHMVLY